MNSKFKDQLGSNSLKLNFNQIEDLILMELPNKNIDDLKEELFKTQNFRTIEKLNVSYNKFTEITANFLKLDNLIYLDISHNFISKISNLKNCKNLEILILSHNKIKNLGNHLFNLKKLQHLDLSYNKLCINDSLLKGLISNPILISLCIRENENYDFDKIRFKCLEWSDKLEFLENLQIFYKSFNKSNNSNPVVKIKTIVGEKKEIKNLKEYIKIKQYDYEENKDLYNEMCLRNKNLNSNLLKDKRKLSSYYYDKLNFP